MKSSRLDRFSLLLRCALISSLALGLATTATAAEPQPTADTQISSGLVTWNTAVEAVGWRLTVSGQGIYLRERYVDAGEIRLSPVGPDGTLLPDGSYDWELRALSPEAQQREGRPRSATGRRQVVRTVTDRGYFERSAVERPALFSGSFSIDGGSFVMPTAEEEEEVETARD